MPSTPKRLENFPHFSVTGVKELGTDAEGYMCLDLSGTFDKLDGVRPGRCWLLQAGGKNFIGDLSSLEPNTQSALYRTFDKTVPALLGQRLAYLDGYWQAYHVRMVAESERSWEKLIFAASDAVSINTEGGDGRQLNGIRKANPVDLLNPDVQIVHNGWDHEHCELCNAHIDPGDCCHRDTDDRWVCQTCYNRYVQPHDLSFVDEI
jgi:hypothetical protein